MEQGKRDWWTAPASVPETEIKRTVETDVLIIGAGQAGICAARAAAETGVRVCVLEKQSEEKKRVLGNGEIGHINSKWQAEHGVPKVDVATFVNDWQLRTNNRSNYALIRTYAEKCGECFDWIIEPLDAEQRAQIYPMLTPQSEHFPESVNGIRAWSGTAKMPVKIQNEILKRNQQQAEKDGAKFFFDVAGYQLLKEGKRVVGAVGVDAQGNYIRFRAAKGVILAAGDYSGNPQMCRDLLTEAADLVDLQASWKGHGWDGSGIQMGIWAGGRLDPRPHPAMGGNYSFPGFDLIGSTAVLRVNKYGRRYSDEGFGTHVLAATAGAKQPNGMLWGIFDDDILEEATYQAPCNAVLDYTNQARKQQLRNAMEQARKAGPQGRSGGKSRILYCADTLETLAEYLFEEEKDRQTFLKTVARYNEMCAQKRDDDFGKESSLLHALCHPPYYACGQEKNSPRPGGQSLSLLVTVGGLLTDEKQNVLDEEFEPIAGLYATGNCCGGRFGFQYTTSIPGQSISIAQTLGREAGYTVAAL